jgi:thiol-disulfide isomerase/thioredoxin
MTHLLRMLFLFGLVALASCQPAPRPLPERTTWHGILHLPETTISFRLELDLSGAKPQGSFIVGDEKTPIPEISRDGDALTFSFSEYGAEMRATWDGGQLKGDYLRHRASGTKSFIFSASPDGPPSQSRSVAAPTGTFQVVFEGQAPEETATVASIWKEGPSAYYGTFIAPDGDYGLLEGVPTPQGIQFGRFTGWQAIAIDLKLDGGNWSGTFHAAHNDKPKPFTLQMGEWSAAEGKEAAMKKAKNPFAFECTALTGETVRHTDDRFKGKALAVDIMGTWCHNCMDESPVLQELYTQYGKDGFEVVGLSFEIKDDVELGKKNLTLFKGRYGLTYPLLYCGSTDDANVDKRLKNQLDNFFAYPTTLFIDKKGKVQSIHSGFQGPGTGDRYPLQVKKLHELTQQALGK